ncbi:hypothetical protein CEV33_3338 [Brucella grignonensis]|uniref:Uncharacterized protein n=1 Tax=Brucella grignonensis TaxID=94627 RepID=A0A256F0E8_9HYPH|nr:hypothetical protein CEV33_3338 [Brucella grignonensis]
MALHHVLAFSQEAHHENDVSLLQQGEFIEMSPSNEPNGD